MFLPPPVSQLHPAQHRLLHAMRAAVVIGRAGEDPVARLGQLLGRVSAARALLVLMQAIGAAWPDPVAVRRPCCTVLTPDETLFIAMVEQAAMGRRPAFDALLSDMIDADGRDCLFAATSRFVSVFTTAPR